MTSAIARPPVYGETPVNITPQNTHFPEIPRLYFKPKMTIGEKKEFVDKMNAAIDRAFAYLAALDSSKHVIRREVQEVQKNSVINLFSYLCCNIGAVANRAFCCCLAKDQSFNKPVPREAFEVLALTREQFDRNTLGVCCFAPCVIIATPFLPVSSKIATFFEILSALVITHTAGTSTYVFSGDIGVVPNGRGDLCVQGGIRVDAIDQIKNTYNLLASRLTEKWKSSTPEEQDILYAQCEKISDNWDYIYEQIADCGLKNIAVEKILGKFSLSVGDILREREEVSVIIHES